MLLSCAGPFMLKANAAAPYTSVSQLTDQYPTMLNNHIYFFFTIDDYSYIFHSNPSLAPNITSANNIINIVAQGQFNMVQYISEQTSYSFTPAAMQINLDSHTVRAYDVNGVEIPVDAFGQLQNHTFANFESNIPELMEEELEVRVTFNPDLHGAVDRSSNNIDGTYSLKQNLIMRIQNNSNFPIQYDMRIMKKNIVTRRTYTDFSDENTPLQDQDGISYDDDPVFIYYSSDWVYTRNHDSMEDLFSNNAVYENKGTCWHYLNANSSETVTFDFSQINLQEGEEYTCTVRCIRNDYGSASEIGVQLASDDPAVPELYQIQLDDLETVYYGEFTMQQYNDVVYNPSNNNNGVLPYNGQNGIIDKQNYTYSRNAREMENGTIDYTNKNPYSDKNSWFNTQYNNAVQNHSNTAVNSANTEYNKLLGVFVPCMMFLNSSFSYYPSNFQMIFTIGFSCIVLLCIIKTVVSK